MTEDRETMSDLHEPISKVELRLALSEFREDVRDVVATEIKPIVNHLAKLNGRTAKHQIAVAVLQTEIVLYAVALWWLFTHVAWQP